MIRPILVMSILLGVLAGCAACSTPSQPTPGNWGPWFLNDPIHEVKTSATHRHVWYGLPPRCQPDQQPYCLGPDGRSKI